MIIYIDDVGISSIAGPAVVCAVADNDIKINGVKDSKKLSKKQRNELFPQLTSSLEYSIVHASVERIEEINIHWAKYEAMKIAVERLIERGINVEKVIVDGKFRIPDLTVEQEAIVKADDKFWACGAASIIAKVYRDNMMADLAKELKYSYYDWENNAGYFTPKHRDGIIIHGGCDLHRNNFAYYKFSISKYKEYQQALKKEEENFLREENLDFNLWKESKKNVWKPILPK